MASLDYYKMFFFAAEYRSFTKAAEALNNNQPNITRCMNNLEAELGCKLFIRSNKGIQLTPEGEKLYIQVSAAYNHILLGEKQLKEYKTLAKGVITIAASSSALRVFLFKKLEQFHEIHSTINLKISNHTSPQAINELKNGLADIAVITSPANIPSSINCYEITHFQELIIGGSRYCHLNDKIRSLHELQSMPFISLAEGTGTRELYNKYFFEHHILFRPDIEVATTDQILSAIQHNLGLGFYPDKLINNTKDVFQIPIAEDLPTRSIYLLEPKSRPQSIAASEFKKFLLTDK